MCAYRGGKEGRPTETEMGATTNTKTTFCEARKKGASGVIDGASNEYYIDEYKDAAARRLSSPRLEGRRGREEEIGLTIASSEFCTIIYLYIYEAYLFYL